MGMDQTQGEAAMDRDTFFVNYVKLYFTQCRRCGKALLGGWGRTAEEAIQEALDRGWRNGFCRDCWAEVAKRSDDE